ncbi:MAG TPA: hypothetical protein VK822_13400 [Acetobacteraceae bacterium]|jgi:hypothetical protein|nr:hypothetical protein [Acetobacteraceae bacterium]
MARGGVKGIARPASIANPIGNLAMRWLRDFVTVPAHRLSRIMQVNTILFSTFEDALS